MGNKTLRALSEPDREGCDPVPQDTPAGQSKSTPPRRRGPRKLTANLTKKAEVIPAFLPERKIEDTAPKEELKEELEVAESEDRPEEEESQDASTADEAVAENQADGGEKDDAAGDGDEGSDADKEAPPPLAADSASNEAEAADSVNDPELIELLEQLSTTIDNANQVLSETPALAGIPEQVDDLNKPAVPEAWTLAQQSATKRNKRLLPAMAAGLLLAGAGAGYWWMNVKSPSVGDGAALRTAAASNQQSVSLKVPVPAVEVPVPLPTRKPEPSREAAATPAPTESPAAPTKAAEAEPAAAPTKTAEAPPAAPAVSTASIAAPGPSAAPSALPEKVPSAPVPPQAGAFEPPADDEVVAITQAIQSATPRQNPSAVQRGYPGQAIALGFDAPQPQNGAEVSVMIQGVPDGAKLSAGKLIGGGTWVLEGKDIQGLALLTPKTFSPQEIALEAAYVKSDGKIPETRSIKVVVEPAEPPVKPATHGLAAADAGKAPPAQMSALAVRGPAPGGTAPARDPETAAAQPAETAPLSISRQQEDALIVKGDKFMKLGDVASARLFFEHAARHGSTRAMIKLGNTYDPEHLSKLGVQGVKADMNQATAWYERASRKADR